MSGQVRDPFAIDGPTSLSFSGGRTSGYMLRRTLDANTPDALKLLDGTHQHSALLMTPDTTTWISRREVSSTDTRGVKGGSDDAR